MSSREILAMVCRRAGKRIPDWTQGAGGNISLKAEGRLFIKASGSRLDSVLPDTGVAEVSVSEVSQFVETRAAKEGEAGYEKLLQTASRVPFVRPSMETGFHAVMKGKWVLHLHSLAGILLHRSWSDDQAWVRSWEKPLGGFALIGLKHPGLDLAVACTAISRAAGVVLLENHGVILSTDSDPLQSGGILDTWRAFERAYCDRHGYHTLRRFLSSSQSGRDAMINRLASVPWRRVFPDLVVFEDRILPLLQTVYGGSTFQYRLRPSAWRKNRGLCELFAALQIIHSECPELAELPKEMCRQILGLESEKLRRQIGKGVAR